MEPLRAVWVVCRALVPDAIETVGRLVDPFVDPSPSWTLERAALLGSRRLVNRIGARVPSNTTGLLLHLHDCNRALIVAVRVNDMNMAKILVRVCVDCTLVENTSVVPRLTKVVAVASGLGQMTFLQWIRLQDAPACWGGSEENQAAKFCHLNTCRWLHGEWRARGLRAVSSGPARQWVLENSATRGDVEILQFGLSVRGYKPTRSAFRNAARNGQLRALEILALHVDTVPPTQAYFAAKGGYVAVLEWLHANNGVFDSQTMSVAAQFGHLPAVKWLHQNRTEGCTQFAIGLAARGGHFETVKWLCRNRDDAIDSSALLMAIAGGDLEIVAWLYRNVPMTWMGNLFEVAARGTSMAVVDWVVAHFAPGSNTALDSAARSKNTNMFIELRSRGIAGFTEVTMDILAAKGNLEGLAWMHENHEAPCTTYAMDAAAGNGHLHVVKWLHEHRQEGCTTSAMDRAAANGLLVMVKWLHAWRNEGCTTSAMDGAAMNGHLSVVEWLHLNRAEGCTERAMDEAARNGHFKVVVFLHFNRNEGCSTSAAIGATEGGHLEILQWLKVYYPPSVRTDAIKSFARKHGWDNEVVNMLCEADDE